MKDHGSPEHDSSKPDCEAGCGDIAMERIRYFNGRYLNARDFRDEQRYHVSRHALHNRLLHGWGVVCGLRVLRHPEPACADRYVVIEPGIAIDCCGREIFVTKKQVLEIPGEKAWEENKDKRPFICLHYGEELIECVPVLDPEGGCEGARKETSRIREVSRIEWQWFGAEENERCGWARKKAVQTIVEADDDDDDDEADVAYTENAPQDDSECDDDCDEGGRGCLQARCPPQECVLLAWVYRDPDGGNEISIEMEGRPKLPPPADYLTHICHINWPHGGKVTLSQLRRMRRLKVTFDRPLRAVHQVPGIDAGPLGVNAGTFQVQLAGCPGPIETVPYPTGRPPHLRRNRRTAVYEIAREAGRERGAYHYLAGHVVFVTLLCDLIPDCRDNSVDGNHLGTLPSGDGVEGGTFYSWFEVIHDHEAKGRIVEEGQ